MFDLINNHFGAFCALYVFTLLVVAAIKITRSASVAKAATNITAKF